MLSTGDELGEQVDAGLVIDAGVEEDIVAHHLIQRRPVQILREAPIAAPMIGRRAAAMRER